MMIRILTRAYSTSERTRLKINARRALRRRKAKEQQTLGSTSLTARESTLLNLRKQQWPPPLPQIQSAQLLERVFSHDSLNSSPETNNERLEFLGDALLYFVATNLIMDRFPYATEARMHNIRRTLICNKTLGEYGMAYSLVDRLNWAPNQPDHSNLPRMAARLFVAYVGALYTDPSCGMPLIEPWFEKLVHPLVLPLQEQDSEGPPINRYAKAELYSLINFAPQYNIVKLGNGLSPYEVDCCIRGSVVGTGVGHTAAEAGTRAAMAALNNPEVLKLFG